MNRPEPLASRRETPLHQRECQRSLVREGVPRTFAGRATGERGLPTADARLAEGDRRARQTSVNFIRRLRYIILCRRYEGDAPTGGVAKERTKEGILGK